jgi:hypothetical protein
MGRRIMDWIMRMGGEWNWLVCSIEPLTFRFFSFT